MSIAAHIRARRDEILQVVARHGAGNVLLFRSVARDEDTPAKVMWTRRPM